MKGEKNMPRWRKVLIITGSTLVFLLLCIFGAELWVKHGIRKAIEKEAVVLAGNPVEVGVGRISVSIPSRSVTVRNITLRSQDKDPSHTGFTVVSLDAKIDRISVRGIGYKKQNGKPAVSANSIIIDSPNASLVTKADSVGRKIKQQGKSLQQVITEKLSSIAVGNIRISGVELDYTAWNGDDNTRFGMQNGDLTVEGFKVDSLPVATGKIFFSDDVKLSAGKISYGYGAGSFVLEADTLSAESRGKTFSLGRVCLVPQYPKEEFVRNSGGHQDWTEFTLNGIECTGVDYAGFYAGKVLTIDSLSLDSGHLASYKNRQVYQEPRIKPMLYQTIQDLPVKLDIHALGFANMELEYDELAIGGDVPGVVAITGWSGTVHNLTNIVEGHDRFMTINTEGTFMDGCRLHAVFHFPVDPEDNHWEVKGGAGKAEMAIFNRTIEPLANLKIKSGEIKSLDFHITGTLEQSHIVMTMLYNDLSVAFMKKHEHNKERGFLTFLADDVLIKSDNPKGKGNARVGEGDFTRNPERSMYNYLWKSVFAGVKKTVI